MKSGTAGFVFLVAIGVFTILGCAQRPALHGSVSAASNDADSLWFRQELHFGSDIPSGGKVTDGDWQQFLDREVSSRFPDGFTVVVGQGQYLYRDKTVAKEQTRILILYYRDRREENEQSLDEIIATYKRMFSQESVLKVSNRVQVKF